jgi:hypothetical protein
MAKIVHKAGKINENGHVSALCFRKPRPIDLTRASWTLVDKFVTCGHCKQQLNDQQRGKDA